jgi:hypothetical protein
MSSAAHVALEQAGEQSALKRGAAPDKPSSGFTA